MESSTPYGEALTRKRLNRSCGGDRRHSQGRKTRLVRSWPSANAFIRVSIPKVAVANSRPGTPLPPMSGSTPVDLARRHGLADVARTMMRTYR